jgi:hypothetical protein
MDAYLLHCLNHVAKAADKIKRNNDRLEQQQAKVGVDLGSWHGSTGSAPLAAVLLCFADAWAMEERQGLTSLEQQRAKVGAHLGSWYG